MTSSDVLEQVVEGAPLLDQLGGALLSDSLHAGNVVAGVSDEGAQVENAFRPHAEAGLDLGGPVAAVLHAVEQRHALADELHQVLVRGDDRDPGVRRRPVDQRGDHVVGLEVRHLDDGNAVGVDQLADDGNLRREILGRRVAARLVVFEEPVAEGLARARRRPR